MDLLIFSVSLIIGFIASTVYVVVGRWLQNESISEDSNSSKWFRYKITKEYKKSTPENITYKLYRRYIFFPTYTYVSNSYTNDVHTVIEKRNSQIRRDRDNIIVKRRVTEKELKVEVI